ncbi:MAG: HAMP domain-containing sensor histidine kinase [Polyangiales bacterium]|nr:HAMP domain-containing histidine kinase [Myxococcales bacterium]
MTLSNPPPTRWQRPLNIVGALLPFALLGLYVWLLEPPLSSPETVRLAGEWSVFETSPLEPNASDIPIRTIRMPERATEKEGPNVIWARKVFVLPETLDGQRLSLFLGETWASVVTVYLNGHRVGRSATGSNGIKVPPQRTVQFSVPEEFVLDGQNVLDVKLEYLISADTAFGDSNAMIGSERVLGLYLVRRDSLEVWLPSASVYLAAVFVAILLALWFLDGRIHRDAADRYRAPILVLGTLSVWVLLAKSTHLVQWLPSRAWLDALNMTTDGFLALVAVEFAVWFWLSPRTRVSRWVLRGMRVLAVVQTILLFYFAVKGDPERTAAVYFALNPVFIAPLFYAGAISAKEAIRGSSKPFGVVMASTFCAMLFSGIHDLAIQSLHLRARIFPAGITLFGMFEAVVVIGGFVHMAAQNLRLSATLSNANVELKRALAVAQEATYAKAEFLANVSHEMRTPLNAIVHLPRSIAKQFESDATGRGRFVGDTEAVRADLDHIARSSRHLLRVINNILDISRLEARAETLHNGLVDGSDVARQAMEATRSLAVARQIEVVATLPKQGEVTLWGDVGRLVQVLENLLSNAIVFSSSQGRVTLTLSRGADAGIFSVHDDGIGIDPAHHSLIFESFRQVESGNTRGATGSGLGLAITKHLVDLHGGDIRVESARGKGSTFTVRIPLASEVAGAA